MVMRCRQTDGVRRRKTAGRGVVTSRTSISRLRAVSNVRLDERPLGWRGDQSGEGSDPTAG
jgi:hypothetical protein